MHTTTGDGMDSTPLLECHADSLSALTTVSLLRVPFLQCSSSRASAVTESVTPFPLGHHFQDLFQLAFPFISPAKCLTLASLLYLGYGVYHRESPVV